MADDAVKVSGGILLIRSKSGTSKIQKVLVHSKRGKGRNQVKCRLRKYVPEKERRASKIPVLVRRYRKENRGKRISKSLESSATNLQGNEPEEKKVMIEAPLSAGDFHSNKNNEVLNIKNEHFIQKTHQLNKQKQNDQKTEEQNLDSSNTSSDHLKKNQEEDLQIDKVVENKSSCETFSKNEEMNIEQNKTSRSTSINDESQTNFSEEIHTSELFYSLENTTSSLNKEDTTEASKGDNEEPLFSQTDFSEDLNKTAPSTSINDESETNFSEETHTSELFYSLENTTTSSLNKQDTSETSKDDNEEPLFSQTDFSEDLTKSESLKITTDSSNKDDPEVSVGYEELSDFQTDTSVKEDFFTSIESFENKFSTVEELISDITTNQIKILLKEIEDENQDSTIHIPVSDDDDFEDDDDDDQPQPQFQPQKVHFSYIEPHAIVMSQYQSSLHSPYEGGPYSESENEETKESDSEVSDIFYKLYIDSGLRRLKSDESKLYLDIWPDPQKKPKPTSSEEDEIEPLLEEIPSSIFEEWQPIRKPQKKKKRKKVSDIEPEEKKTTPVKKEEEEEEEEKKKKSKKKKDKVPKTEKKKEPKEKTKKPSPISSEEKSTPEEKEKKKKKKDKVPKPEKKKEPKETVKKPSPVSKGDFTSTEEKSTPDKKEEEKKKKPKKKKDKKVPKTEKKEEPKETEKKPSPVGKGDFTSSEEKSTPEKKEKEKKKPKEKKDKKVPKTEKKEEPKEPEKKPSPLDKGDFTSSEEKSTPSEPPEIDKTPLKKLKEFEDVTFTIKTEEIKKEKEDFCIHTRDIPEGETADFSTTTLDDVKPKPGKYEKKEKKPRDICPCSDDTDSSPAQKPKEKKKKSIFRFFRKDICVHTVEPPEGDSFSVDTSASDQKEISNLEQIKDSESRLSKKKDIHKVEVSRPGVNEERVKIVPVSYSSATSRIVTDLETKMIRLEQSKTKSTESRILKNQDRHVVGVSKPTVESVSEGPQRRTKARSRSGSDSSRSTRSSNLSQYSGRTSLLLVSNKEMRRSKTRNLRTRGNSLDNQSRNSSTSPRSSQNQSLSSIPSSSFVLKNKKHKRRKN